MMKTTSNLNASSTTSKDNKQVFDLSLMKEKSLPVKTALFKQDFATNAQSPNLDDSSVSTIGSNTSELYSTGGSAHRRSLFSKYWVKTGESPAASTHTSSSSTTRSSPPPTAIIEISDDQLSQEEDSALDLAVNVVSSPISTSPPRRTLFSQQVTRRSASLNCLDEVGEHHHDNASTSSSTINGGGQSLSSSVRRGHKSEGELISHQNYKKKQPVSCLRESRFSFSKRGSITSSIGGSERRSSICSEAGSVVQFDMESTEVRHFVKPTEVHAEDGWTNYFS